MDGLDYGGGGGGSSRDDRGERSRGTPDDERSSSRYVQIRFASNFCSVLIVVSAGSGEAPLDWTIAGNRNDDSVPTSCSLSYVVYYCISPHLFNVLQHSSSYVRSSVRHECPG